MTGMTHPNPETTELASRLLGEGLVSLAQIARMVPSYRGGRATSPGCVWRWCTRGARARDGALVLLEAVNLSGRYLSSEPALARFLARLTEPRAGRRVEPMSAAVPSPSARRMAAERAGQELDRLGL